MFKPIIHNLSSSDAGYNEAQHYNHLIGNKPKNVYGTLVDKIKEQAQWKADCNAALDAVRNILQESETL